MYLNGQYVPWLQIKFKLHGAETFSSHSADQIIFAAYGILNLIITLTTNRRRNVDALSQMNPILILKRPLSLKFTFTGYFRPLKAKVNEAGCSVQFSNQNFVWICHLPTHSACSSNVIYRDLTWLRAQVTKLVKQVSTSPCPFRCLSFTN